MSEVSDTRTLTSSPTSFEPPAGLGSAWLVDIIVRNRSKGSPPAEPSFNLVVGSSSFFGPVKGGILDATGDAALLAAGYKGITRLPFGYPFSPPSSAARSSTTLTERSLRRLLRAERREELLRRLSPERRATYERIRKLREEIGTLDFDVVEELRELRENG